MLKGCSCDIPFGLSLYDKLHLLYCDGPENIFQLMIQFYDSCVAGSDICYCTWHYAVSGFIQNFVFKREHILRTGESVVRHLLSLLKSCTQSMVY